MMMDEDSLLENKLVNGSSLLVPWNVTPHLVEVGNARHGPHEQPLHVLDGRHRQEAHLRRGVETTAKGSRFTAVTADQRSGQQARFVIQSVQGFMAGRRQQLTVSRMATPCKASMLRRKCVMTGGMPTGESL